jgi:exopolysaccharide production protein ExoZ
MSRLEFLDAGRGIAILGVIAVHTVQHFSTGIPLLDIAIGKGQFGVQLFFIVSAYTMQHTLVSRAGKEEHPILNFWIRRYCRIAIPFWAGMVVYEAFRSAHIGFFASTSDDLYSLVTSFLLVQGFWPSSMSSVVPGGVTIATEVIFYVLFPLIFFMRGSVAKMAIFGVSMIALDHIVIRPIYLKLFALFGTNFSPGEIALFFHLYVFNQFPTFLFGVYIYIIRTAGFRRAHIAAIVPFLFAYFFVSPNLAAVSLIGGTLLFFLGRVQRLPSWLVWIGRYSYSLYLFHFAVLNLLLITSKNSPTHVGISVFLESYVLAICGAVAVSLMTKPLLEDLGSTVGRYLVGFSERRAHAGNLAAYRPPTGQM